MLSQVRARGEPVPVEGWESDGVRTPGGGHATTDRPPHQGLQHRGEGAGTQGHQQGVLLLPGGAPRHCRPGGAHFSHSFFYIFSFTLFL